MPDRVTTARGSATVISLALPGSSPERAAAAANLAVILASHRNRILMIDCGRADPSVDDYLRPFAVAAPALDEVVGRELAAALAAVIEPAPVHPGATAALRLHRYAVPTGPVEIDVVAGRFAGAGAGAPPAGRRVEATLRAGVNATDYRYVLVNTRTELSAPAVESLALLSDVVAVPAGPDPAGAGGAELIRAIGTATGHRLLVVPVLAAAGPAGQPDPSPPGPPGPAGTLAYGPTVRLPTRPPDGVAAGLAALLEGPGDPAAGRLPAYEQLAAAVTGGRVPAMPPVPPAVRQRYRQRLRAGPDRAGVRVLVAHAPRDRSWADWVAGQLRHAGAAVGPMPAGDPGWLDDPAPPAVLVVGSAQLARSPAGTAVDQLTRRTREQPALAETLDVVTLLVPPGPATDPPAAGTYVDLTGCGADQARGRLLARLHLAGPAPSRVDHDLPRFPGGAAAAQPRLPARNPAFVGRDHELTAVRDQLAPAAEGRLAVVTGPAGVGKSELAREFVHRFGYDYDLVGWVNAQDEQSVRLSLAGLSGQTQTSGSGDVTAAVLDRLAGATGPHRWLLVYDNADDLPMPAGLVPGGRSGHVLVTTRAPAGAVPATGQQLRASAAVPVSAFPLPDSIALLDSQVPGLAPEDARRVAQVTGSLPLALRLATDWLRETARQLRARRSTVDLAAGWSVAEYLARVGAEPGPADPPGAGTSPLARAVAVTISTLGESELGRVAVRLAQLCAFLSPQGVGLRLVRSRPMLRALAAAAGPDGEILVQDADETDRVVWIAARYGLFEVDWGRAAELRMHRVLQALVIDNMPAADRAQRRAQVLQALAGYAPTVADEDLPGAHGALAELRSHLVPSGAPESAAPEVRRWVVAQVRHLYQVGDAGTWRATLASATTILDRWTAQLGAADEFRLRLAGEVANLHRALGDAGSALALSDEVLAQRRRQLGLAHPRTLTAGRGRSGDLRGLGHFEEALAEDQTTWEGVREAYGSDHLQTLRASHNLALSFALAGQLRPALEREQDTFARRQRLYGIDDPFTWASAVSIGVYQRELGDYDGGWAMLKEALTRVGNLRPRHAVIELLAQTHLAATERLRGDPMSARERNTLARAEYESQFGPDHPRTRACVLRLAADHHALGDHRAAVRAARTSLDGYLRQSGPDHPFTQVCRANLSSYLRHTRPREALELARTALAGLTDRLGDAHPWVLAAAINHANCLALVDDLAAAERLETRTLARCRELLEPGHPYLRAAAGNLAGTRQGRAGEPPGPPAPARVAIDIDVLQT
jgi:hypothetical protein